MNENAFASAISCCIFTQFFTVFTIFPKRLSSPLANVLQIAEHKFQYSIVSAGVLKGPQTGLTPVRQFTVCVCVCVGVPRPSLRTAPHPLPVFWLTAICTAPVRVIQIQFTSCSKVIYTIQRKVKEGYNWLRFDCSIPCTQLTVLSAL